MKKSLLLLLFLLFFCYAEAIKRYEIKSTIKENGSVAIIEQIKYSFDGLKHGIYRDIPLQMKIHQKIKNITFKLDYILLDGKSVPYTRSFLNASNGKNIRLKIGSSDRLIKGVHTYTIAYTLSDIIIPNCQEKKDCISLNSVGNGWDIPIYNITALYYLPDMLAKKVEVQTFSGAFGSKESQAKLSWLDSNTLKVSLEKLNPKEGLTTTFIYPSNLIHEPLSQRLFEYWYLLFFVGIFGYLYRLYKRFIGFEDTRSVAVMYEPPKGISVLEAGLILDSNANNKDYAAAIIELASKGFIKIHKSKSSTTLEKIDKDTSTLPKDLAKLYELLFKESNRFILQKDEATAKRLQEIFTQINELLYQESLEDGYFQETPTQSKKKFFTKALLLVGSFLLYSFYYVVSNYGVDTALVLIFPFTFSIVSAMIYKGSSSWLEKFIALFFFAVGMLVGFGGSFSDWHSVVELVLSPVGLSFILVLFVLFTSNSIAIYTQKGAYLKKHLLGLEEFIKRVKEDEIKRRLQSDPLYLEKLLPYAMLFGVTSHWVELFTKLGVTAPMWYDGEIEDLSSFDRDLNSSAHHSQESSQDSDFGGGGFSSGGGAGGGGGGSW